METPVTATKRQFASIIPDRIGEGVSPDKRLGSQSRRMSGVV